MIIWYAFEFAGAVLAFVVALVVGGFILALLLAMAWDKLNRWSKSNGRRS